VATELGPSQISTLLEALPGIANVLRSPVADALINVIRAAARLSEFQVADAEELVRYATRRSLLGEDEGERVLAEVKAQAARRAERASGRSKAAKARPKSKPKPKPKPKTRATATKTARRK
jgi:urease accessory protein UreF